MHNAQLVVQYMCQKGNVLNTGNITILLGVRIRTKVSKKTIVVFFTGRLLYIIFIYFKQLQ